MNRIIRQLILILLLLYPISYVGAQLSQGGFPLPEKLTGATLRSGAVNEWLEMPPFDLDSLKGDTLLSPIGGLRFAYGFNTHISPEKDGVTQTLPDGTRVWRVKIRSTNAKSINLIFDQFHLKGDAKLFLYSPNRSQIRGAYTQINNHLSGMLATSPIDGDEIVVEYIEPKGAEGTISIGTVNHGFRNLRDLPSFGNSQDCHVNISCSDLPDKARRSTVLIILHGEVLCSGALINNTAQDGTPYLLSASHCLETDNQTVANKVASTSIFYFNYESPHCMNDVQGSLEMSLSGATIVDRQIDHDLLLMRLDETPPVDYNAYLSGWDISDQTNYPVYTVHHPQGDVKKGNKSLEPPVLGTFDCCDQITFASDAHWRINGWEYGITEGGSSGAPLFNHKNQIIGALSGGYEPSGCGVTNTDFFYRIDRVWNSRASRKALSSWLDPTQSQKKDIEGMELYSVPCSRVSNYLQGDSIFYVRETDNDNNPILEWAEKYNHGGTIFGVHFITYKAYNYDYDSIWVKVYDATKNPYQLLYKQRIRISDNDYNYSRDYFSSKVQTNLTKRDNYQRFNSPVTVDSSFVISIEVPEKIKHAFSLYASMKDDGDNSAYIKQGDLFIPLEEKQPIKGASSLFIEPRMQLKEKTGSKYYQSDRTFALVSPNPTHNIVEVNLQEKATCLMIYNIQGELIIQKNNPMNSESLSLINFPQGLYILRIIYPTYTENYKIIKY